MIGRTLGGATVSVLQGVAVFVICLAVGFRIPSLPLLPLAFIFVILTAMLFTAVGTALGSILPDFQGFQLVMNFLVMPIFFLSGALFPLNNIPRALSIIANLDPLSYSVDGLRFALIGVTHFGVALDLAVLCAVAAVALTVGGYVFSRIEV